MTLSGIIKNREIIKICEGHATHFKCVGEETFHIHEKSGKRQYVPSLKDIQFCTVKTPYIFKKHYIFTRYGFWIINPNFKSEIDYFKLKAHYLNNKKFTTYAYIKKAEQILNEMGLNCKFRQDYDEYFPLNTNILITNMLSS